nr:MAG TPA: hypothetical protein [Caudoviricetes sp.]
MTKVCCNVACTFFVVSIKIFRFASLNQQPYEYDQI